MRRAFTLLELLVSISIIAVLMALLIPAVQKVREAANRIRCANNLHQIALGLQGFHGLLNNFPSSYIPSGPFPTYPPTSPGWGWGEDILPYLERDALYWTLSRSDNGFNGILPFAKWNELTQTTLHAFRCPSDGGPDINDRRGSHGLSNYRATEVNEENDLNGGNPGGVMYCRSRTRITDLSGGGSNTIVVGECRWDETHWAALWAGMPGTDSGGTYLSAVEWRIEPEKIGAFDSPYCLNGSAPQAFGSWHPGGVQFAFADGSVRMLNDSLMASWMVVR